MSLFTYGGKSLLSIALTTLCAFSSITADASDNLELDVISYEDFVHDSPEALAILEKALYEKGIVGIRGVPEYREKYDGFIQAARVFTALSEEEKERCAPNRDLGETFLGYESGKEKFQLPDGRWVIDNLKVSYYAHNPDGPENKWPTQIDFQKPYTELTSVVSTVGLSIMEKIGMIGEGTNIHYGDTKRVVRMLYYKNAAEGHNENPYWCGAHFDHCLLTGILPAVYFKDGIEIAEPEEAGLFIRTHKDQPYRKVIADDYDVMMFQVGEFGQLATNDKIRATEHRVHKAYEGIERYTMATFINAPMDSVIRSYSELTNDERYGAAAGEPCSFEHWHLETFKRFLVTDENK